MPTYTPPNFNSTASFWFPPATPAAGPASYTQLIQLYVNARDPLLMWHPGSGRWLAAVIIRQPFAAAVALVPDMIVSVPNQPTFYYRIQYVQRMHSGFPNQYSAGYAIQCNANGSIPRTPLPT